MTAKDDFSVESLSPDELQLLGAGICLLRVKLGLSQRDLVNETFYERLLNDVESGQKAPSKEFLDYLAECLGTTTQELLEISPAEIASEATEPESPRIAEQELALMNAHVNIEITRPDAALYFLAPYKGKEVEFAPDLLPVFYRLRGNANLLKRDFKEAEADLTEAFNLLDHVEPVNILQREIVRNLIGLIFYRQGLVAEAIKTHRQSLEAILQNNITNRRFRLKLFSNLANEYYLLGKHDLALNIYKNDALPLAEHGEDDLQVGLIYWGAGMAYRARGELGQAVLYLDRSVKIYQKYNENAFTVQVQDQLGLTFIERGDYHLAEETLFKALSLVETLDEPRSRAIINANIAYLYQKSGQVSRAKSYIDTAIEIERRLEDKMMLGQALVTQAEIKLALGDIEAAFQDYEEAVRLLEETGQQFYLDQTFENYVDALKNQGRFEKALEIRFRMSRTP